MALRPIHGRAVWARAPASVDPKPHRALAARLDDATGRFTEQRQIGLAQVGASLEELA